MTDRRNVVKVRIVGEEYTLRTEASEERTRAVAAHVDRIVRTILDGGAVVETHKAAILAALQITDELFTERAAAESLTGELRALSAELLPLLPPAKRRDDGGAA
jgi:cell division protein ZapA